MVAFPRHRAETMGSSDNSVRRFMKFGAEGEDEALVLHHIFHECAQKIMAAGCRPKLTWIEPRQRQKSQKTVFIAGNKAQCRDCNGFCRFVRNTLCHRINSDSTAGFPLW